MLTKSLRNIVLVASLIIFGAVGCTANDGQSRDMNRSEKGALLGASIGVLLGGLIKKDKQKAVLFGIVGGVTGAVVGNYMDQQRQDFEEILRPELNAGAINIQKMPEHRLLVTMTGSSAFDVNSTNIKSGFIPAMDKIAKVVQKYGKTSLYIVGHTDSSGSHAYNQKLSERRAKAVYHHLERKNVIPQRLTAIGRGEEVPRASNATVEGRRLNRRVDIVIEPLIDESTS